MDFTPPKHLIIARNFTEEEKRNVIEKLKKLNLPSRTYYIRSHTGRFIPVLVSTNENSSENSETNSCEFSSTSDPLEGSSNTYAAADDITRKRRSDHNISDLVQYIQPKLKKVVPLHQRGFGKTNQKKAKKKRSEFKDQLHNTIIIG